VVNLIDRANVIVVDDDSSVRIALQGVLKSSGFNVESFSSAEELLASGALISSACLITDYQMPGMTGLELQERLVKEGHRIPIIFVTAYGDESLRSRAMKAGAVDFLDKPFDDTRLIQTVQTAIKADR